MHTVLLELMNYFGNKPFLRHQAQVFPQFSLKSVCDLEEADSKKTAKMCPLSEMPHTANILSSHVIYKLKVDDDRSLKLEASIAAHGNEESARDLLRSDCSMCPPAGFRIVTSIATLMKWRLTKIDIKTAFLQSGKAERDVFVALNRKVLTMAILWALLTSAYGLMNSNAKLQNISDQVLVNIIFSTLWILLRLFMMQSSSKFMFLLEKIVNDILICRASDLYDTVVTKKKIPFMLETISHGLGLFRFFGLNIIQHDDYSVAIDGNNKIESLDD